MVMFYVDRLYKQTTIHHIPRLLFLDNVEISDVDRSACETSLLDDNNTRPQMIFYCHRIMGLRPPPKDKKNKQTIHLEIKLPLLERIITGNLTKEKIRGNEARSHTQTIKKHEHKGNDNEEGRSKKGKSVNKTSPYDRPDEFDPQLEEYNVSFKTEKLPWNHVMEFPPVLIDSTEGDVTFIRDSMRTRVKVDVVYIKAAPQSKAKSKKGLKAKKGKKSKTKLKTTETVEIPLETPKEAIVKKVTLFSFYCNLQSINWSDETVDYLWMDHPDFKNDGLKTKCLKNLVYSRHSKKAKKSKKKGDSGINTDQRGPLSIPNIFTCHVGFGLNRN